MTSRRRKTRRKTNRLRRRPGEIARLLRPPARRRPVDAATASIRSTRARACYIRTYADSRRAPRCRYTHGIRARGGGVNRFFGPTDAGRGRGGTAALLTRRLGIKWTCNTPCSNRFRTLLHNNVRYDRRSSSPSSSSSTS